MESYLIAEIIEVTKDPKSRAFWEKMVRVLGEGVTAEEFGELKYQMHIGEVRDPAKYLTALLMKQVEKRGVGNESRDSATGKPELKKLNTHFEINPLALFTSLAPQKTDGQAEEKAMELPYGKDAIPWATFISSIFFTLSTNKAKSDMVRAKFRTLNGEASIIPLVRGRINPGGRERGIPTADHGRVLAAIEYIWAQQGCQYYRYPNGSAACYCNVSIRELAKLMGRSNFGGNDFRQLSDKVFDLKTMPYYLDLSGLGLEGIHGYGFTLLKTVELIDGKRHGQTERVLKVEFATPLSVQLLNRRTVSRAKELPQIQSELGFLLRLYLEPILLSLNGSVYTRPLKDLIDEFALPRVGWHGYRDKRRRHFAKAIESMNEQKTADGRLIILGVRKGLSDWMLTARLGPVVTASAGTAQAAVGK